MKKNNEAFHGSDLEKIENHYGILKENILSFSANVNPMGISPKLRETLSQKIDAISSYPDREYKTLRQSIADYANTTSDHIVVGNGSTELISLLIQIHKPKKAIILGPTYSEYEREISMGGGTALYFRLPESQDFKLDCHSLCQALNESIDLLVICNPNNPTGTSISHNEMRTILDTCKEYDILVMVDETYVEFTTNMEQITAVPLTNYYNNIVILRGISKFFAAPGLRLGYAICGNDGIVKEMNTRKNPWTINALAAIAGEIMFSDKDYIHDTKQLIAEERTRICHELRQLPSLKAFEPSANFMLVKILNDAKTSKDVFEYTLQKGYMIRDCSSFPFLNHQFFRFCFLKPEQNDNLLSCIKEIL